MEEIPNTPANPIAESLQKFYVRRRLKNKLNIPAQPIAGNKLNTPAQEPIAGTSQNFYVRRRLKTSSGVSMFSGAPSFLVENKGSSNPIAALPTKVEIVLEFDDTSNFVGYAYMDSGENTRKSVVEAELSVLTIREEQQLLYGNSVTSPIPQSSPSATNRSSFDMMSTCFSTDSMSQCKSDDQQNKQESQTKNDDCKFNATNCIGRSTLPSTSSLSGNKNNLKRRPDGGTNLNERPQKRRKKRGYRPKVVSIGRPRRTLEPKTPQKATPRPTTRMPSSSKKNIQSYSKHGPTNQSNDGSAIILATPPRKVRIGCQKAKDSSLDSEGSGYFAAVDAEAEKLVGSCINQNDCQYNAFQLDQTNFLVNQCLNYSKRAVTDNHDQDAHVTRNDQGILVPYQGQRDQGTHSPHGQFGMLAAYKGKNNKRLAKLSHSEYELALTWKVQMQDKVNEGQIEKGDRKFSPRKGSVVDSVVGVFLTRNVSDHFSSSAFMSLAARFPCQSTSHETDYKDKNMVGSQELTGSRIVSIMLVTDEELLTWEAAEYGNKESRSDESNDLEEASRSLCGSYKPPEVSQIHFNEKVDHLEILEDSVVSYNHQVQQKISTEVGFHASEGMSSLPPECSSQTKDEMAA
ncbi:DEMETER-like protein 2 isoform X1 [Prunus yedoensis var. nudiflora]|uniref:DEMETER-like protein 2 isoform X1 n=1 Tax=Prunus yedoensis var. nudiflora TaxID=2094558 RepID=A0A314ZCI4_PRUYE|nr:DEMETER-like protein 2 isoform X1 [Prunus yedoensis var. nudiflora]